MTVFHVMVSRWERRLKSLRVWSKGLDLEQEERRKLVWIVLEWGDGG